MDARRLRINVRDLPYADARVELGNARKRGMTVLSGEPAPKPAITKADSDGNYQVVLSHWPHFDYFKEYLINGGIAFEELSGAFTVKPKRLAGASKPDGQGELDPVKLTEDMMSALDALSKLFGKPK